MIFTACYINNFEAYQLLDQNWGVLLEDVLVTDSKLSALVTSHGVNVVLVCHEGCVFATTCDLLDGDSVHAKSRLWHVETCAAESFFRTLAMDLVTKPELTLIITAPTKDLGIGVVSRDLNLHLLHTFIFLEVMLPTARRRRTVNCLDIIEHLLGVLNRTNEITFHGSLISQFDFRQDNIEFFIITFWDDIKTHVFGHFEQRRFIMYRRVVLGMTFGDGILKFLL